MPCAQPVCGRGRHVASTLRATPGAGAEGRPHLGHPGQQRTETGPREGHPPHPALPGAEGPGERGPGLAARRPCSLTRPLDGRRGPERARGRGGGQAFRGGGAVLLPPVSSEGRSTSSSLSSTAGSWEGMTESCRETGCHDGPAHMSRCSFRDIAGSFNRPSRHSVTRIMIHITQTQLSRSRGK